MVKKLFKHEFYAFLRTIFPMHLILAGIAVLGRIIQLFDNNSAAYNIVFWSSVVAFCIGVVVCILLTFIFGIRRFYTNLFTSEGYLSFTLPVTPTQHILVKNTVAVISQLFSFLMIILATCVITLGDVCTELFKAAGYIVKLFYEVLGFHTTFYIIEIVLIIVAIISSTYMLFYACIALGQRAKKNRVACAVGIFFLYYLILQILATIVIIIANIFYDQILNVLFNIFVGLVLYKDMNISDMLYYYFFVEHTTLSLHSLFGGVIVVSSLLNLLYFAVTKSSITKKLNLE